MATGEDFLESELEANKKEPEWQLEPVWRFFLQHRQLGHEILFVTEPCHLMKSKKELLQQLQASLGECERCRLSKGRTKLVFGEGNAEARLVVVGEAPGRDEDVQGRPFVGRAGQLLTKMLQNGMGMARQDVYICNVCKCRPPENRAPQADEMSTCEPFLKQQLAIIQPEAIIAMGNCAVKSLMKTTTGITRLRGRFTDYEGIPLMPTYHPAYLLRYPGKKSECWEDLKKVMNLLGLPVKQIG